MSTDNTPNYYQKPEVQNPNTPDWDAEVTEALQNANDSDSHVERDDSDTLHPSHLGQCRRQAFVGKMGISDDTDALGYFVGGTLIHECFEEHLDMENCVQEHPIEFEHEGIQHDPIRITGTCDFYDPQRHLVADWKTRGGWYNFDPPKESHLKQLTLYQAALADGRGPPQGQIVYVNRKDIQDVRVYPKDGNTISFDKDRFESLVEKADDIRRAVESVGIPDSADEIPFEKCGCYPCQQEQLSL